MAEGLAELVGSDELTCPICTQVFCVPVTTECQHSFCRACLSIWLHVHEKKSCPACRTKISSTVTDGINHVLDAAVRETFPQAWEERRAAATEASDELWKEHLPYLLCTDDTCVSMVKSLLGQRPGAGVGYPEMQRKSVATAMLALPRAWFLPPSQRAEAYCGRPTRLESLKFNVSAPGVYSHALELLDLQDGHSFLDVGSGCGLLTCIGAGLVAPNGHATGIDIRSRAVAFAKQTVAVAKRQLASLHAWEGKFGTADVDRPRAILRVLSQQGGKFRARLARCSSAAAALSPVWVTVDGSMDSAG